MVGASSLALLASMFALKWFGLTPRLVPTAASLGTATSANAWDVLTNIRWLLLATAGVGICLFGFQATRRAPAIPVSLSVIATVLGLASTIAILYRLLLDHPGPGGLISPRVGTYVGLALALAITYGGYLSMRDEGIATRDAPDEIETIRLSDLPDLDADSVRGS